MKKINFLLMLLVLCFMGACTENALDILTGKPDIDRYVFNTAKQEPTAKLKKGIKVFTMTLSDGTNSMVLKLGSSEWVLPYGTYSPVATVTTKNQYSAVVNGNKTAVSGNLEVTLLKDIYFISGLLTDAAGNRFKVDYKGTLTFEVGIDDPEASGYTIAITENPVTDANKVVYPSLTKYAITILDPSGTAVCELDAVNKSGLSLDKLVGTYTLGDHPTQEWLGDKGWVIYAPQYNYQVQGGTYFTDAKNVKQYVSTGDITITSAKDFDGNLLYSLSGKNLNTLTTTNVAGTGGAFNILFASEIKNKGKVLKDQIISSTILGMDMKYTVYLPASWDGTKTFPVLYMLHGADGGNNDWVTGGKIDMQIDAAVATGKAPEMIVIMPNCTVNGKNLFYCNGYQGTAQYMTYFFDEFLPTVEAKYKVQADRKHRAIGGLSMGGYGSLYYGGLHPEMFSYVYACSPATSWDGAPNLYDLYGAAVAGKKTLPDITMEIGTSDFLYTSANSFKSALDGKGIANEYITRDGIHDWAFWSACAPKIVAKVGTLFLNN